MIEALKASDPTVQDLADLVLRRIGPDAVPALVAALRDPDNKKAVQTLGHLGPQAKAAVPELIQILGHKDPMMRSRAATVLGLIGAPAQRAVPALADAIQDPDPAVRRAAVTALLHIVPKE